MRCAPGANAVTKELVLATRYLGRSDMLDLAVNCGVVQKKGSWFSHGEIRLGQGRERVRTFFMENTDLMATVRGEVLTASRAQRARRSREGPPRPNVRPNVASTA